MRVGSSDAGDDLPASLDAYVRVSYVGRRGGERFLSPRLQEEVVRAYAHAHGLSIGRLAVELDRSGTDPRRPELAALIARIESGQSGGLIVVRLDRLGRSVVETLRLLETIDAAGARFVSVEDGFDSSTPFGKAMLTILLALAELELGRLADSARTARARAVGRGVHWASYPPTGYLRGAAGILEPDPRQGPLLAEAFRDDFLL